MIGAGDPSWVERFATRSDAHQPHFYGAGALCGVGRTCLVPSRGLGE